MAGDNASLASAYQRTLGATNDDARMVRDDLASFCGARAVCYQGGMSLDEVAFHLGARRVWLRIDAMLRGTAVMARAFEVEDVEGLELAPRPEG